MSMQPQPVPPAGQAKRTPVELIKENSRFLAGTLKEELAKGSEKFNDQDKQLLKFHGSYQQDDRDARKDRHKEGAGKSYIFMVRCKIPGGRVTAEQYLAIDKLADDYANGTLRITSRQGFQLHGVLMKNLKKTVASINHTLLTTLGACGDVERNVMSPPAPLTNPVYQELYENAARIAQHLAPRTRAYHELWLDGDAVYPEPQKDDTEPIYGKVYLPRKFKTGLTLPTDNSVDIYAQDLGFLADVQNGQIVGYDVLVGGGMGMTHGNVNTFPFVARAICYIGRDQVVETAEAVVKLFRDHGNRGDRKRARIKYVVHDWGVERFREVLSGYLPFPLVPPRNIEVTAHPLHLGWNAQGDGKFFYGISVHTGRIKDTETVRLRTALRKLVERFQPQVRLTPDQDILLCGLEPGARAEIEKTLTEHGVTLPSKLSQAEQYSLACPAIPTCGLAISEAERVMPDLIRQFEETLGKLGLKEETISIRMTGCPNGCVRPYQSDVGIVGRSGDKYTVFVGGSTLGHRLNFLFKDLVPFDQIVPTLVPLFEHFKKNRQSQETFGDYCQRLGETAVRALAG